MDRDRDFTQDDIRVSGIRALVYWLSEGLDNDLWFCVHRFSREEYGRVSGALLRPAALHLWHNSKHTFVHDLLWGVEEAIREL